MTEAALIIASPWPRTGTANLFAAQSLFLSSRGYRTAILLNPHRAEHRVKFRDWWTSTLEAMRYEGVHLLCRAITSRRTKPWLSLSFLQWLINGRDSQLAIMARYAAAAELPPELLSFLNRNDLRIIVVNHCFQMQVAEKILRYLEKTGRPRPAVVLETIDVQARLYSSGQIDNVFKGTPDAIDLLEHDELRLAGAAQALTYVTAEDMRHACPGPQPRHLVLATIAPETEKQLLQLNGTADDDHLPIDFLYVGNNNPGNALSIQWFLNEVAPLLDKAYSITIVGNIAAHIKSTNRELFERFEKHFVGEVSDIVDYYRKAAVVIAPTKFGTGTSIKTIEALAAGKPIVATTEALRGLPSETTFPLPSVADEAAEFASAMVYARRNRSELGERSRRLYLELFSNEKYFERWDGVLAAVGLGNANAATLPSVPRQGYGEADRPV